MKRVLILILALCLSAFVLADQAPKKKSISLDFRDAPIEDVLRTIAKQSGYNIIMSENVKGNITINLKNVSPEEAIKTVASISGFVPIFSKENNIFKIVTPDMAEREASAIIKVRPLKYITAIDAWRSLRNVEDVVQRSEEVSTSSSESSSTFTISEIKYSKEFIIERVTIGIDEKRNALILFGLPKDIERVLNIIEEIDKPTRTVLIDALIIEVGLNKGEDLGIDWNLGATAKGAVRPTTFPFSANSHELSKYYPYVTPNDSGSTPTGFPAWGSSLPFSGNPYGFPLASTDDFSFGTLDFSSLTSTLHFLKTRNSTHVISHPRIVTLDGRMAKIQVGDNIPVPSFTVDSDTGNIVIDDFSYKDTGVILYVKPEIIGDDKIRLQVHPQISSVSSSGGIETTSGVTIPAFSTRQTDVEVDIKDGYTLAIGGLMKNNQYETVSKVPFLGDIPLIGRLFSYTSKNNPTNSGKTELLIFITVHILGNKKNVPFSHLDRFTQRDLRKAIKNYHVNFSNLGVEEMKPKHTLIKTIKFEKR